MTPAIWRSAALYLHRRRRRLFAACAVSILGLATLACFSAGGVISKGPVVHLLLGILMFVGMEASGLLYATAFFRETANPSSTEGLWSHLCSIGMTIEGWWQALFLAGWLGAGWLFLVAGIAAALSTRGAA